MVKLWSFVKGIIHILFSVIGFYIWKSSIRFWISDLEKDLEKDFRFCVGFLCWILCWRKIWKKISDFVLVFCVGFLCWRKIWKMCWKMCSYPQLLYYFTLTFQICNRVLNLHRWYMKTALNFSQSESKQFFQVHY